MPNRSAFVVASLIGVGLALSGCSSSAPSVDTQGLDKVEIVELLPSAALIAETFGESWSVNEPAVAIPAPTPQPVPTTVDGMGDECLQGFVAVAKATNYAEGAGVDYRTSDSRSETWVLFRFSRPEDANAYAAATVAQVKSCAKPGQITGKSILRFRSTPSTVDGSFSWDLFGENFDTESHSILAYGNLVLTSTSKSSPEDANKMLKIQLETLTGERK